MADTRATIANALKWHLHDEAGRDQHALEVADTLLALPGIAIIQLPEPVEYDNSYDCVGRWRVGEFGAVVAYSDGYIIDENGNALGNPAVVRELAAALLAAANAAEQADKHG